MWGRLLKKTRGRQSRATVPLKDTSRSNYQLDDSKKNTGRTERQDKQSWQDSKDKKQAHGSKTRW
jgi:hypothetical protein